MPRIVAFLYPIYLLLIALMFLLFACGDMGRVTDQSFHCMTEGGSDYCRPAPTAIPGSPGPKGDRGDPGTSGSAGADGKQGQDGYSIVTSSTQLEVGHVLCPTGGTLLRIARDLNRNGTLDNVDDNQLIATICNGADGSNGKDGKDGVDGQNAPASPFTPVAIIDPCGDAPGIWDEVFLRMSNGTLLASFSDSASGQNTRFSVLTAGSYVTTDNSHCYFNVDSNGAIYNEHY